MKRFAILLSTAAVGITMAAASINLSMTAGEGDGKIVLPDGRAAIQFAPDTPKDIRATWPLAAPLAPGWHTFEVGFGPEGNTRKLVNLEWLDAQGVPVFAVDAYHLPSRSGKLPVAVLGIYLSRYWLQTPARCRDESVAMRQLLESKVNHLVISFAYPINCGAAYDARGDYVLRAQRKNLESAGLFEGRQFRGGRQLWSRGHFGGHGHRRCEWRGQQYDRRQQRPRQPGKRIGRGLHLQSDPV